MARLGPDAVAPSAVLILLDQYCRILGGPQAKAAALSALILLKLGRRLFPESTSFQAYLADTFRVYSPDLLRCNPTLVGFLSLSTAYDRVPFDVRMEPCLRGLINEVTTRSPKATAFPLGGPTCVERQMTPSKWVGASGNLSNGWFECDSTAPDMVSQENVRLLSHRFSRMAKWRRSGEPGKQVLVRLSSSQSAAMARGRWGELCGARTTRNSFSVTCRSAAVARADWIRVRPSSPTLR